MFFGQLHGNAQLLKHFTSYFLTLMLRVATPMSFVENSLISLVECLYKLVAKVQASKLRRVMDALVTHTNQLLCEVIKHLIDGVVVVNEITWI